MASKVRREELDVQEQADDNAEHMPAFSSYDEMSEVDNDEVEEYVEVGERDVDDDGTPGTLAIDKGDSGQWTDLAQQGNEPDSNLRKCVQPVLTPEEKAAAPGRTTAADTEAAGSAPCGHDEGSAAQHGSERAHREILALEEQADKVAQNMQKIALVISHKLSAGLKTALGTLGTESSGLSSAAGGLANWWESLDPGSPNNEQMLHSSKAVPEMQELFGLPPEEDLIKSFKCKLIQDYECSHNNFTPPVQMAFQGFLHITSAHTCFSVQEGVQKVPLKVPHSQISRTARVRPPKKGTLSDVLHIDMSPGSSGQLRFLALKDFASGAAMDSALALIEHFIRTQICDTALDGQRREILT